MRYRFLFLHSLILFSLIEVVTPAEAMHEFSLFERKAFEQNEVGQCFSFIRKAVAPSVCLANYAEWSDELPIDG